MRNGLACRKIAVMAANGTVEEQRETIHRTQRRFLQLGMDIIQTAVMLIA